METKIDISKLSLIELKALCYDKHTLAEKLALDIQVLEAEINKRTLQTDKDVDKGKA